MKTLNQTVLLTGILAGIVASFMTLGAISKPYLAFFLYAASALPIFIAGLGWGNKSAIVAIITTAVITTVVVSPMYALNVAIFTLIPAGWLSNLANLARPASEIGGPEDLLAWYPLSNIMIHLCGLVTVAVIILGWLVGFGPEMVNTLLDQMIEVSKQDQALPNDELQLLQGNSGLVLMMIPIVQGGFWVLLLFTAYYAANRILSLMNRNLRPREDMPSTLRMPRNAVFFLLAGMLATFVDGPISLIGAVLCGTFGAGFLLSGFASIHHRSKGKAWRLPVLVLAYTAATFIFPLFIILVIGLIDSKSTVSLTPVRNTDSSNN